MTSADFQRIAIVVLLAGLLIVQAVQLISPTPSEACVTALDEAAAMAQITGKYLDSALDDYDNAAYTKAENINQQIFMAGEQSVMLQHATALILENLLKVQIACR